MYQSVFNHSTVSTAVADPQGQFLEVNPAICRLFGYTEQELLKMSVADITYPDDLDETRHKLGQLFNNQEISSFTNEKRIVRKDGEVRWVMTAVTLVCDAKGQPLYSIAQLFDIHAQKEMAQQLQESHARLTESQQIARMGHWEFYPASGRVRWSDELYNIFGIDPQATELSHELYISLIHPDDRDKVREALDKLLRTKRPDNQDYRIVRPDGEVRYLRGHRTIELNPDGNPHRIMGTAQDITELFEIESELATQIHRHSAILKTASDGFWAVDREGNIKEVNDAYCRIIGYSREELLAMHISDVEVNEDIEDVKTHIQKLFDEGYDHFETHHRHKDGTVIDMEISASYGMFGGKELIFSFNRDISRRKQREMEQQQLLEKLKKANAQLLQSEKMASVGQLAAGVAHEINNPVGFISSNLTTLSDYVNDLFKVLDCYAAAEPLLAATSVELQRIHQVKDEVELDYLRQDIQEMIAESRDGTNRVKQIVQDLKDFSRSDEADDWHWSDLHQGINSTLNIARNEIKYRAEVIKEYGELPQIQCIPAQLNQVFMNLLVNAAHAIEGHGTITIATGCDTTQNRAWVEVRDTGKGIEPESLKRIFDPFFTTKPVGQGTGLGLSLSYGIIEKHNGTLTVESEPGKGSIFRVTIPIQQSA